MLAHQPAVVAHEDHERVGELRAQRREQHPHGEDSIRFKVEALQALEKLNDKLQARFLVIDDECPDGSGDP